MTYHIYEEVVQMVQSQEELSVYCQFLSCAEPDSSQTASWATNHISLNFKSYALRLSKTHEINQETWQSECQKRDQKTYKEQSVF